MIPPDYASVCSAAGSSWACGLGSAGLAAMFGISHCVLVEGYGEIADDALVTVVLGLESRDELWIGLELDQVVES